MNPRVEAVLQDARGQFRVAFDSFDIPQGAWGSATCV